MSRPRPWRVLDTERVADCRVFEVLARRSQRDPQGPVRTFYTLECPAWVNVVARTAADQLVMVRQFRHGKGAEVLEIPGGLVDPGEEPLAAAARELLEETGYRGRMRPLGRANPNPALFANVLHTFVADDCERVAEIANDGDEETIVELVPVAALPDRIRAGEVDNALVLSALFWLGLDPRGG